MERSDISLGKMGLTLEKIDNNGWSCAVGARLRGQGVGAVEFMRGEHCGLVHREELRGRVGAVGRTQSRGEEGIRGRLGSRQGMA